MGKLNLQFVIVCMSPLCNEIKWWKSFYLPTSSLGWATPDEIRLLDDSHSVLVGSGKSSISGRDHFPCSYSYYTWAGTMDGNYIVIFSWLRSTLRRETNRNTCWHWTVAGLWLAHWGWEKESRGHRYETPVQIFCRQILFIQIKLLQ